MVVEVELGFLSEVECLGLLTLSNPCTFIYSVYKMSVILKIHLFAYGYLRPALHFSALFDDLGCFLLSFGEIMESRLSGLYTLRRSTAK